MDTTVEEYLKSNPLRGFITLEDAPIEDGPVFYKARYLVYPGGRLKRLKSLWGLLFGLSNLSFIILLRSWDHIELQIFDPAHESEALEFVMRYTEYLKLNFNQNVETKVARFKCT